MAVEESLASNSPAQGIQSYTKRHAKLIGATLIIAGTATGAGMLALPVSTGMAGTIPSLGLFFFYWCFMTMTALFMLEANLKMDEPCDLVTMAKKTLGPVGQYVAWAVYLFLLYSLMTAYIAGSGEIVVNSLEQMTGLAFPGWMGILPLLLTFGYFTYNGTQSVDLVNRCLMIGLVATYAALAALLSPHVDAGMLTVMQPERLLMGISVVATSFGFHIVIPSLVTYLDRDAAKLRLAIIAGSLIPLLFYSSWEVLSLGIIPLEGANSVHQGYIDGSNGATLISHILAQSNLGVLTTGFSLFSIVTSFLGVALSLSHFLADGLKVKKESKKGSFLLILLTFIPPFCITLVDPRAFLTGLEFAGAFGVVVLLGLYPALMVWRGRYHGKFNPCTPHSDTPGGKLAVLAAIAISLAIIGTEAAIQAGLLS
jgi:tyrosine-specific transport protein